MTHTPDSATSHLSPEEVQAAAKKAFLDAFFDVLKRVDSKSVHQIVVIHYQEMVEDKKAGRRFLTSDPLFFDKYLTPDGRDKLDSTVGSDINLGRFLTFFSSLNSQHIFRQFLKVVSDGYPEHMSRALEMRRFQMQAEKIKLDQADYTDPDELAFDSYINNSEFFQVTMEIVVVAAVMGRDLSSIFERWPRTLGPVVQFMNVRDWPVVSNPTEIYGRLMKILGYTLSESGQKNYDFLDYFRDNGGFGVDEKSPNFKIKCVGMGLTYHIFGALFEFLQTHAGKEAFELLTKS